MHYEYQVKQSQSGQWLYAVFEVIGTERIEIEGGAGFETENEASEAAYLAVAEYRGLLAGPDY